MLLTYFSSEWFLFLSLPILLSINLFINKIPAQATAVSDLDQTTRKKRFFIALRLAQFIISFVLLNDFFSFYWLQHSVLTGLVLHGGNFFFRFDTLSWFINISLSGITLYYLYLVAFSFTRTYKHTKYVVEIPFLIICTLLSLRLFIAANDLILVIILLEITTFCSIIMMGLQCLSSNKFSISLEATIKYFIINAISVSFLLFSILGYYYLTKSTNLNDITTFFFNYPFLSVFVTEYCLLIQLIFLFAYFIKIGVAPIYQWVPDVYEGVELLITAFLVLLVSPALMFKFLMFFKQIYFIFLSSNIMLTITLYCGILSLIIGTLSAFYQTRIKRFIAYSGLTHIGFMLIGLSTNTLLGYFSFIFYLIIYIITNICFFTLLLFCQHQQKKQQTLIFINQLKYQLQSSFFFLCSFLICIFSFAGIPPFGGFFAKFFVLSSLIQYTHFSLILFVFFAIIVGTFLYLRFIKIIFFEEISLRDVFLSFNNLKHNYKIKYALRKPSVENNLDMWSHWLLAVLFWLLGFLTIFFFFFPLYSLGLFELIIILLTTY